MILIPFLIIVFWVVVFSKKILFWIWLWQLKQYYGKRVLDHFRTFKGRRLLFNVFDIAKIGALIGFLWLATPFTYIIFLIYLFEVLVLGSHIVKKDVRYPVLTQKAKLILSFGIALEFVILFFVFFYLPLFCLLIFDILLPLILAFIIVPLRFLGSLWQKGVLTEAKRKREKLNKLLTVGITGSYGKTSTKEILSAILEKKFKVFKTLKHQNTDPVVAQYMLDRLDDSYQVFVAEIGAYFRGGVKSACNFIQPKIGILTGINQQHLALFGSQQTIIRTKYELIESLSDNGSAIFNGENKHCLELYNKTNKAEKVYGFNKDFDVWAEDIKIGKEGSSFKVFLKNGESAQFKIKLLGKHNILNVLAAVCAAKEMGISLGKIAVACAELPAELGGMILRQGIDGLNIIDSSYSSNPDGVISALEFLATFPQRKVLIMPCLIELGRASKEVHRQIGKKIAQVCDLAIITTKDRLKEIKEGAGKTSKVIFLENPQEIVEKIKSFCQPGDTILLEGRISRKIISALCP